MNIFNNLKKKLSDHDIQFNILKIGIILGVYLTLICIQYCNQVLHDPALSAEIKQESADSSYSMTDNPFSINILDNPPVISYGESTGKNTLTLRINADNPWQLVARNEFNQIRMTIEKIELLSHTLQDIQILASPQRIQNQTVIISDENPTPEGGLVIKLDYSVDNDKGNAEYSFPLSFDLRKL